MNWLIPRGFKSSKICVGFRHKIVYLFRSSCGTRKEGSISSFFCAVSGTYYQSKFDHFYRSIFLVRIKYSFAANFYFDQNVRFAFCIGKAQSFIYPKENRHLMISFLIEAKPLFHWYAESWKSWFFRLSEIGFFHGAIEINEPVSYYCYFVVVFAVSS